MVSRSSAKLVEALEEVIWGTPEDKQSVLQEVIRILLQKFEMDLTDCLSEWSDEALILAWQKDVFRKETFEECLVHRYEKLLFAWFNRRCRSRDSALDLVQTLYVKLWTTQALFRFDPQRPFSSWLFLVARNLWIDLNRKAVSWEKVEHWNLHCASTSDPSEEAEMRELEERVSELLCRLPENQKVVLRASMDGRTSGTIAQELNLPIQRVYRLLFEARRSLRRLMRT